MLSGEVMPCRYRHKATNRLGLGENGCFPVVVVLVSRRAPNSNCLFWPPIAFLGRVEILCALLGCIECYTCRCTCGPRRKLAGSRGSGGAGPVIWCADLHARFC